MNTLWKYERLMTATLLVAALALTACGDDGTPAGGGNNLDEADVGVDAAAPDAGGEDVGEADAGERDTGDEPGEDASPQPDTGGDACDLEGFTAPADMVMDESATGWTLFGSSGTQLISLSMANDGGLTDVGTVSFENKPLAEQANALVLADGCTPESCETFFLATSGTLEISTWSQEPDGRFEARLIDVELVEIAETDTGFTRVDDGMSWCIDSLELSATTDPMDSFPASVSCDRSGFTALTDFVTATALGNGPLIVEALDAEAAPQNALSLQIYPSYDGAAVATGSYQIDDFNYATCANCLLVYAGCDGDTCEKTFIAGEGSLEVSRTGMAENAFTAGEQFTATLTGATLVEVEIDSNYDTELVPDGESWCIDSFSWDLPVSDPAPSP